MLSIRKVVTALAFALSAVVYSGFAGATNFEFDLGALDSAFQPIGAPHPGASVSFEDLYTFDILAGPAEADLNLISLITRPPSFTPSFPLSVLLQRWDSGAAAYVDVAPLQTGNPLSVTFGLTTGDTPPAGEIGQYHLLVSGTTPAQNRNWGYAGEISVTSVPEPSQWLLLASGLAFVGVVSGRRLRALPA